KYMAKSLDDAENRSRLERHRFDIGDLAWLAAPIASEKAKKFKFRWIGPVRVVGKSIDHNRYALVELLPNGKLLPRLANAARMKPYFRRVPVDDPTAIATATKDDFEAELEAWKSMRPVHKRPAFKMAKGISTELIRRANPDAADLDPDDPEFYIERLDKHSLNAREKRYYYHVKWFGHGTCHNLWLPESEIPAAVVTDYWERTPS
ncbi:hypothetical protein HDU96_001150, partial [Phlyctochytrium bullatum]